MNDGRQVFVRIAEFFEQFKIWRAEARIYGFAAKRVDVFEFFPEGWRRSLAYMVFGPVL
jgi:hypothetical protein